MIDVRRTETFERWLRNLRDKRAAAAILTRLDRVAGGNLGDVRPLRDGVSEFRVDVGAGYKIYFVKRGSEVIILFCGGDKGSQHRDIARALDMARRLSES